MEPAVAKEMIKGAPDVMSSAFHLQYSMILNLMRVEGADPVAMLQQSFKQFQVRLSGRGGGRRAGGVFSAGVCAPSPVWRICWDTR